ncbi:hypothetical protein CYPRO_3104 [Cyclonatronum proteinivorum]|uniref:Uncharacterized protein n=1 Tax=Cyclonatronum proteinivorum TaxID=1457365 RepID=A0A345UPD7_9BACT|nr:hypothetical protein [Cyclonatronum proteinivorum]AXJ02339.1 hypothetical protein CYPRO_3104 [Cyclonatronum proteinivorum]
MSHICRVEVLQRFLTLHMAVFANVQQLDYNYDIQSCFNENKTVQAALYESLTSELRIDALNTMLEIPITEADVANLRPLSQSNATDVELCTYIHSIYPESKWNNIGNRYYIYHYRANDFFFNVYLMIPKSPDDPDFVLTEDRYRIINTQGFDVASGFQSSGILTGLKNYPGMVLPDSSN